MESIIREIYQVYPSRHLGWVLVKELPYSFRPLFAGACISSLFALVSGERGWWMTVAATYSAYLAAKLAAIGLCTHLYKSTPPVPVAASYRSLIQTKIQSLSASREKGGYDTQLDRTLDQLRTELPDARMWRELIAIRLQVEAGLWSISSNSIPDQELFELAQLVYRRDEPPHQRLSLVANQISVGYRLPIFG